MPPFLCTPKVSYPGSYQDLKPTQLWNCQDVSNTYQFFTNGLIHFQVIQKSSLTSSFQRLCPISMKRKLFSLSQDETGDIENTPLCPRRTQQHSVLMCSAIVFRIYMASFSATRLSSTHTSAEAPHLPTTAWHTSRLFATTENWILAFIYLDPFYSLSIENNCMGLSLSHCDCCLYNCRTLLLRR